MKVRFDLNRKHYRQWKVYPDSHYHPDKVCLVMINCTLKNSPRIAQTIKDGANKTVCAWIDCDSVQVLQVEPLPECEQVTYNPREYPWWNLSGENVDGKKFKKLITHGRRVFVLER